jgi:hypothetical protein
LAKIGVVYAALCHPKPYLFEHLVLPIKQDKTILDVTRLNLPLRGVLRQLAEGGVFIEPV